MKSLIVAACLGAAVLLVTTVAMAKTYEGGELVEVEWKGAWYKARVLEIKGDRYLINYIGWHEKWDEWVTTDRMRKTTMWKPGDLVEVYWRKAYHKARVLQRKSLKLEVHYLGQSDKLDEWVHIKRVRASR